MIFLFEVIMEIVIMITITITNTNTTIDAFIILVIKRTTTEIEHIIIKTVNTLAIIITAFIQITSYPHLT